MLRGLVWATAAVALVVGVHAGLARLEQKVHALDRYDPDLTLSWVDLPDWLAMRENRHILDSLTERAGLKEDDHLLDPGLAERIGRSLSDPHVGWVKSVERVMVRSDGEVTIRCRFRRPAAWVRHGAYCYLVDEEGVRLPGRYDVADCRDGYLMMVSGVRMGAPEVGEPWRGADLSSGLELTLLLSDRPFRRQVTGVIVENHGGREDRSRPHIELTTDRRGSRIWWGRPPDEELGAEIAAAQKIMLLDTLYRQWGRIDMNRAYVNIMTWPDKIAMPAAKRPPKSARLLRG